MLRELRIRPGQAAILSRLVSRFSRKDKDLLMRGTIYGMQQLDNDRWILLNRFYAPLGHEREGGQLFDYDTPGYLSLAESEVDFEHVHFAAPGRIWLHSGGDHPVLACKSRKAYLERASRALRLEGFTVH